MKTNSRNLWVETYKINSLLVNPFGKLGLYGALNLLQETAWMHAESWGFGMKSMEQEGLLWVITRQNLVMKEWPGFGETLQIKTWVRPPEGAFITREFRLCGEQDRELGTCVTSWLALDKDSKKILPIQSLRPWDQISLTEATGLSTEKISVSGAYEKLAKYRVRNSDLDTNQHVNNTKYAQWILDSVPYDLHRQLQLKSYAVNFLAETHLGDQVQIDHSAEAPSAFTNKSGESTYRGLRTSDERILFTAKLGWSRP